MDSLMIKKDALPAFVKERAKKNPKDCVLTGNNGNRRSALSLRLLQQFQFTVQARGLPAIQEIRNQMDQDEDHKH